MASVTDNKKIMSFVKRLQDYYTAIIENNNFVQALVIEWQNEAPDVNVEGSLLSPEEVTNSNTLIINTQAFIDANQVVIDGLLAKNTGSHKGNALN